MTDEEIRKIIIRRKKRKHAARKALAWALILIVMILFVLPSGKGGSFDKDLIEAIGGSETKEPDITAKAAEIYSLDLGRAVYQKNPDEKIDPYSITKVMTCYLAIENLDPGQVVRIDRNKSEDYVDGSHILLLEGEELTVNDLLHATMMVSANDAAFFLAEAVSGSEKEFAKLMTEQTKEWGCENTNFVNSNGWKNKNHYTTAHDMSIITAKCFESKALRELAAAKEYTIPETSRTEARELKNYFMESTDGIDGIICGKTGSWEEDDCSIVLEFEEDYLSAVIVLLRDTVKKRPSDIKKLKEYSHAITPGFKVADAGDIVCSAGVKGGAKTSTELAIDKTIKAYPKSERDKDIKVYIDAGGIEAPVTSGTPVGRYSVMVEGTEKESGDLIATEDIEKGWLLSGLYISNESTVLGGILLLLAICFDALIHIIKKRKNRA